MKLHLNAGEGQYLISGYGAGYVAVNRVRYERSVVVTPEAVTEWRVPGFDQLTPGHFAPVVALKPEVVIFGTGRLMRFPGRELSRALGATGIGLEVMENGAACRTYNILAADGRKVVAAILID